MIEPMLGGRGIDRHAADGIARGGAVGVMGMVVAGVIVTPAAAAGTFCISSFGHWFSRLLQPIPGRGI